MDVPVRQKQMQTNRGVRSKLNKMIEGMLLSSVKQTDKMEVPVSQKPMQTNCGARLKLGKIIEGDAVV